MNYKYHPTASTYFSGGGGMDYGLMESGIDVIQSLEIDSDCINTLKANFSHTIIQEDIKNITVLEQKKADIIVGTYPCTRYSELADIHGTRTGDDLFLHFFRHIAISQPEAYLVENVPGMKKFKVVMEAMTKLPNYYINIFCPVSTLTWLPQERERLIIFGTKRNFSVSPPEESKRVRLKDIIEKDANVRITKAVYSRMSGKYRDKPIISDPEDPDSVAPCCLAHYSKDRSTRMVKDKSYELGVRPYTKLEYARLQGFPDSFTFYGSDNSVFRQIGNAVAPPMARWAGTELMKYFNYVQWQRPSYLAAQIL